MTLLDAFLGLDVGELASSLRSILRDPQGSRVVTYRTAGDVGTNFHTGKTTVEGPTRTVRVVGGPTQDRHTGQWSVGDRTYLALRDDFQVPTPSVVPNKGDWIEESDGSTWTVTDTDFGDLGEVVYYVLKTRRM